MIQDFAANFREAYYSHHVRLVSPVYSLFSMWTVTAKLIYETFTKHGTEIDDIQWEQQSQKFSEHSVSCVVREGPLTGSVRFRPLVVELFLSTAETLATPVVPSLLEDALKVLRALEPDVAASTHRVAIAAHLRLKNGLYADFLRRLVSLPSGAAFLPQSLTLDLQLGDGAPAQVDLQPSTKFKEPDTFFGMVTREWGSDLDIDAVYSRSLEVARLAGASVGFDWDEKSGNA